MKQRSQSQLIFVNRYYRPDHSATSQLLTDVAEHLAAAGADVVVFTSRQLYEDAHADLPKRETLGNVTVCRLWSLRFGRAGILGRALDYASFLIAVLFALLKRARRGDVVVAKTDPPFLGLVASLAGTLRGVKVVNWLQDLFPEVAFAAGVRVPRFLWGPLVRARDRSLRAAVANVAIGRIMAERIERSIGLRNVRVIHNWAPFAHLRPIAREHNALRKDWNLGDRFTVGYSGNLGRAHEFETIVRAAEALQEDPEITFLIIGGGAQREALARAVKERNLGNVVLKPYQPAERLAESLSAADAHIVNLRPELEGLIVPSKFYGILAAGRPTIFIGDPGGEIAALIESYQCGISVHQGDHAALAAAIRELRDSPPRLAEMSENAQNAARRSLGRLRSLDAWRSLLDEIRLGPCEPRTS